MSVRSEITRISGEVSNQANLIAQIGEALEDKSADVGPLDGDSSASTPIEQNTAKLQTILDAVDTIPDGTDTSDATAAAGDILSGKTAYVKGSKVTGTIATKTASNLTASGATVTVPAGYYASQATKSVSTATQATPSISVSSSGLITASATQTAGYVSAGTKSATEQLTTKAATTYTPTTSNQTIAAGTYCSGVQTIKGDANLKAENIASGVSIFGVTGTHSGIGSGGGSGASFTQGIFTLENNDMIEPDVNEYMAYTTDLNLSSRSVVLLTFIKAIDNSVSSIGAVLVRLGTDGQFTAYITSRPSMDTSFILGNQLTLDENAITFQGYIDTSTLRLGFIAI